MLVAIVVFTYLSFLISQSRVATDYEGNGSEENHQTMKNPDGDLDLSHTDDREAAYTADNDDDELADMYYEPFDPEKNGFLLHEYFDQAYKKYPDYDTTTMKLNLNYYGDVLLAEKNKNLDMNEEADVAKFTLDPVEKEMFLNENVDQEKNDIQEAKNDNDNDSESEDSITDEEKITDGNQPETDQPEDWFEDDNQAI